MFTTYNSNWPWYPKERINQIMGILLSFVVWPFGTWIYCVKHPQRKSSYVVFFLFSLLLCWHMSPMINSGYDDFIGIKERFEDTEINTFYLLYETGAYFSFAEDSPKELYEDFLIWLVKTFTQNYHFFFLLASVPIAVRQLKSLRRITRDINFQPTIWGLFIMLMFIFPRDIITTQNPRFATGFWICVLSSLSFFCGEERNWKYLLLALLAPLCHSGLLPFVVLLLASAFIPKNLNVLRYVALISIPFCFFDAGIFEGISFSFLPSRLASWVNEYMSEESYAQFILKEGKSGFWWVDAGFQILMKVAYIWMTLQIISSPNMVKKNTEANSIISLFLLIFAFTNITQFVPEFGTRYYNFLRVFCVYTWFKTFGLSQKYMSSIYLLMIASLWPISHRYGYILGGALSVNTPTDIFYTPLPYLMGKGLFW